MVIITAKIIDGKKIAAKIRVEIRKEAGKLSKKPGLAVIIVGDDPASKVYVSYKHKACKEAGIDSYRYEFTKDATKKEVLSLIKTLNKDEKINGILVQLPLPPQIDPQEIMPSIAPEKDVDCFHPCNTGAVLNGAHKGSFVPATPKGVMRLIESTGADIAGKEAVVVGRSNTVGKPLALLLLEKNATVTVCHSKTKNLSSHTKRADILVAAAGCPGVIKAGMVKKGAVVIDVGITRKGKKLLGDVDFEAAKKIASYITTVPGGVGPMTIAMLLENTLIAYGKQNP